MNNKQNSFQYNGLKIQLHQEVYEPAEDTYQLIDSLKITEEDFVLEIGTGCGIIALECCRLGANVICTDINPYAVYITKKNYEVNKQLLKGNFEIRRGDLFNVVKSNEKFDKIIFNPPYLPTKSNELVLGSGWFDISVNGGKDGLTIIKKYIKNIDRFLKSNGQAYFVFSSLSKRVILEKYIDSIGYQKQIISSKNYDGELLDIYCINTWDK